MLSQLSPKIVHLWHVILSDFFGQKEELIVLLNEEERRRAYRFKFEIHRNRFIVARAMLRKILSSYTQKSPEEIEFIYGNRGKPYLHDNLTQLQFNLSHSDDCAVLAITQQTEIGIDVEKAKTDYHSGVAKRFFSTQEYNELMQLPLEQQAYAFYKIWVKKEAIIKVLGEGLYASLADFSVQWEAKNETILVKNKAIDLHSLNIDHFHLVSIATLEPIEHIQFFTS